MNFNNLKKTFIIAEIGNNHEGSFGVACKLINEAKKAGADAVKFQTFKTEYYVNQNDKKRFKKLKEFELSYEDFAKLSVVAKKNNLKFISTPFDIKSAIFLNNIVDFFKISSGDNNYFDLIKVVLGFNKPTFISTGFLNFKEIKNLIKFTKKNKFDTSKLCLFHCVSDYPVSDEQANLLSIKFLKDKLSLEIGYSDHTIGIEAPILAISLGAKIIEKHFTLSNNFSNFRDHKLSLNPADMKIMVKKIRKVQVQLGKYEKVIGKTEKKLIPITRRSMIAKKSINKNQLMTVYNTSFLRPQYKGSEIKNEILNKKKQ